MSSGHSHGEVRAGHEKKLLLALGLTTAFMIAPGLLAVWPFSPMRRTCLPIRQRWQSRFWLSR